MSKIETLSDQHFSGLKDMQHYVQLCIQKNRMLEDVLSAKEPVTYDVIDKCREAVLQLNQSHHVVTTLHEQLKSNTPDESQVEALLESANKAKESASSALDLIISWVPVAINTRLHGVRRA